VAPGVARSLVADKRSSVWSAPRFSRGESEAADPIFEAAVFRRSRVGDSCFAVVDGGKGVPTGRSRTTARRVRPVAAYIRIL